MNFNELTLTQLTEVLSGSSDSELAQQFPFYPLASPGMPPPGPNFTAHARAIARNEEQDASVPESPGWMLRYLYCRALYDPSFEMPVAVNMQPVQARLVTGHLWGSDIATGPVVPQTDEPIVMVIGKTIGREEAETGLNFCGPTSTFFRDALSEAGILPETTQNWYVTNLVRWMDTINPKGGALPAAWIKDCLPLVHQELRLVRPHYVLCLGAEATKAVIAGETLKSMAGRFVEMKIPLHEMDEEEEYHVAKVMAITHPAAVTRNTEQYPGYIETLRNFKLLLRQGDLQKNDDKFDFRYIYTERELSDLVDEIIAEPGLKKIAVDAEWHGEHPGEPGSYLRTIQFSHKKKFAAVVVLTREGGDLTFMPGHNKAAHHLNRLLDRDDVQIIGHFFQADLPWLEHFGIHIKHRFKVPDKVEDILNANYAGGFDTALAAHAHDETGEFKLEVLGTRYCGAARWDVELNKWKKEFIKQLEMENEDDLEGYGMCPSEILLPYGAYDAAYTRELADLYAERGGLLDRDRFGLSSWIPFHSSMLAFPAFLEMHMVGLKVDRARVNELTDLYERVLNQKIAELQEEIRWPGFNPNSPQQCKEFLFGARFSGKIDKETGMTISVRPEGAMSLELTPIKTSGHRGKPWQRVVVDGTWQQHSPCTDKEVLGILGAHAPLAAKLRDIRFLMQVLKSVLRRPERDRGGNILYDENNHRIYKGGLISFICQDDRVRSAFLQVMETGRASSKRPPLQNISNKREADYSRILDEEYMCPMRTIFISDFENEEEPTVIIGADYSGAELLGQAVMSRDTRMIEHCMRAALPDGHPDQYDIHSNIAVLAFNLNCEPSKKGLKDAGKKHLRIAAKNIIFGVGYGRGAEACSRQCKEEGAFIEPEEAQRIIDTIFTMYAGIPPYQDACRRRVHNPSWMKNAFGRIRRFVPSSDTQIMGELERQALNFPMQSLVADAVSQALHHLMWHPRKAELGYKMALQLHDAIYLEVPTRSVDAVYHEVMPECMVNRVSFRACNLDGIPYQDSPNYQFTIDKHVYIRWGGPLTKDVCDHLKISQEYSHGGDD